MTVTAAELAGLPEISRGGEGTIVRSNNGTAYKIFHQVKAPSSTGQQPGAQSMSAAAALLAKIGKMPFWALDSMAIPTQALTLQGSPDEIIGFEMPLVKDSASFSKLPCAGNMYSPQARAEGISSPLAAVAEPFLELYDLLWKLEGMGVVAGDLKHENVLITGDGSVCLVDVDSCGISGHPCTAYTEGYVDPRLCDTSQLQRATLLRGAVFDAEAMWYSYTVMLFEKLVGVHPFGGVHMPKNPNGVEYDGHAQVMKGLSIFHDDVIIAEDDSAAFQTLPTDLQDLFRAVFVNGKRGRPARELISQLIPVSNGIGPEYSPEKRQPWAKFPLGPIPQSATSNAPVCRLSPSGKQALGGKMINGKPAVLGNADLTTRLVHLLKNGFSAPASDLALVDFSDKIAVYGEAPKKQDQRHADVWVDYDQHLRTMRVSRSQFKGSLPFNRPNIAVQQDQFVLIPDGTNSIKTVGTSSTSSHATPRLDGDLSLFSGSSFGLVFATKHSQLSDVYLVSKDVHRIEGLPPIVGDVTDIDCCFSDKNGWIFLTTFHGSSAYQHIIVIGADGKLQGLGSSALTPRVWHSPGAQRCAYDIPGTGGAGLAAIANDSVVRVEIRDFCLTPVSVTELKVPPPIFLADARQFFGAW